MAYGPESERYERWYFRTQKKLGYVVICNTISKVVQLRQISKKDKPEEGKIRILDLNAETFIKVFHEPYFYEMTNLVVLPETPSRIIDKLSFPDQEYEYDMLDFSCTSLSDRRIHFQTDLQIRMNERGGMNWMPVDIHREIATINYSLKNRRTSLIHFYGLDLAIFFTEVPDMLLLLFASRSKYYFEVNLCLGYLIRNLTFAWTCPDKIELLNMTLSVFKEPGVSPVTRLSRLFWLQSQFFLETLVPWTCLDGLTDEEIKFQERYFTQMFCDCLYHILFSTTWYLDDYEGHDQFETRAIIKEKPFENLVKHPLISQGLLDQIRWLRSNLYYSQERFAHPHGIGTVSRVVPEDQEEEEEEEEAPPSLTQPSSSCGAPQRQVSLVQSVNSDQEFNNMAPNKRTRVQGPVLVEVEKSKTAPEVLMPPPQQPPQTPRPPVATPTQPDTPRPSKELPLSVLTREPSVHSDYSLTNLDQMFAAPENSKTTDTVISDSDGMDDYPPNRWSQQPRGPDDDDDDNSSSCSGIGAKRKRTFRPSSLFPEHKKSRIVVRDYYEKCTFHFHIGKE